jgi:hypothetical protein
MRHVISSHIRKQFRATPTVPNRFAQRSDSDTGSVRAANPVVGFLSAWAQTRGQPKAGIRRSAIPHVPSKSYFFIVPPGVVLRLPKLLTRSKQKSPPVFTSERTIRPAFD